MRFGYVRVSSNYQNEARQVAALQKYVDSDHIIIEKASGKDFVNRIEYQKMKKLMLRSGDELFVTSIDRLGRNKEQIADELRDLKKFGISLRILDIPVSLQPAPEGEIAKLFYNTMMDFMIGIMASFAHAEHIYIKQRQAEGIEQWRLTGKTKTGRPYVALLSKSLKTFMLSSNNGNWAISLPLRLWLSLALSAPAFTISSKIFNMVFLGFLLPQNIHFLAQTSHTVRSI